jgi:hypothetical protein
MRESADLSLEEIRRSNTIASEAIARAIAGFPTVAKYKDCHPAIMKLFTAGCFPPTIFQNSAEIDHKGPHGIPHHPNSQV